MLWTNDPAGDWDRYQASLPQPRVCDECSQDIYDDYFYDINGECLCRECFVEKYGYADEPRACECCGKYDELYFIIDGEILCEECANEAYREENE